MKVVYVEAQATVACRLQSDSGRIHRTLLPIMQDRIVGQGLGTSPGAAWPRYTMGSWRWAQNCPTSELARIMNSETRI